MQVNGRRKEVQEPPLPPFLTRPGDGAARCGDHQLGDMEEGFLSPSRTLAPPCSTVELGAGVHPSWLSLFFQFPLELATFSGCEILEAPRGHPGASRRC